MKLASNVIVVGGEEEYFIDQDVEYFRRFKGYTLKEFDGSSVEDTAFVSASQTPSIDFEALTLSKDVLVLKDAQELRSDKALKAYFEKYSEWKDTSRFHLVVYHGKVPSFWAKTQAQVRVHDKLKSWESQNEVLDWLQGEVKSRGIHLSPELVKSIYLVVGPDLYRLSSELKKLSLYLDGKPGSQEDIRSVITPGTSIALWDVTESVMRRDLKGALNRLSRVYRYAGEDPSLPILSSLMKSTERTLVARSMVEKGSTPDEVATVLGMHPYRYKMSLGQHVDRNTVSDLTRAMGVLAQLEVSLKRTPYRRTALELAIHQLLTGNHASSES